MDMSVLMEIMEKIPTTIPSIVSDDLNLFACKDDKAILMNSKIRIAKSPQGL
jgi:hypothetical protein